LLGALIGEDNGPHPRLFLKGKSLGETNGVLDACPYRQGVILVERGGVFYRPVRIAVNIRMN
jgi:hypothetical protein